RIPGHAYFKLRSGKPELLQRYWSGLLGGMPAGYDRKLSLAADGAAIEGPWSLRARYAGKPAGRTSPEQVRTQIRDIFAEPARALALVRGTSRNAGALYMFIAREVIRVWDASGEQVVREGVRGIGRERGTVLREKHTREGRPLNLKTLMEDWDGPLVSTWVFNEGYLSEGAWHQDCRYCPYADVWSEFGKEGLALGLLYDIELHTTMYTTYHPGTIVRWDELKTRGDHLCKFRISIPELASPNDPEYKRPGCASAGPPRSEPVQEREQMRRDLLRSLEQDGVPQLRENDQPRARQLLCNEFVEPRRAAAVEFPGQHQARHVNLMQPGRHLGLGVDVE